MVNHCSGDRQTVVQWPVLIFTTIINLWTVSINIITLHTYDFIFLQKLMGS